MPDLLSQYLRDALRSLRRNPAFSVAAVLSLALGLGASTALFTVLDAIAMRTLPVGEPSQLVTFRERFADRVIDVFPYEGLERFRQLSGAFSDVAGVAVVDRSNVATAGVGGVDPSPIRVALASGNYFSTLGVSAGPGRLLTPADDRVPDAAPVAVISDAYWKRRFARDPGVLGRTLRLHATTYTIVGVTRPGFVGDWVGRPVDVWVPLMMQSEVMVDRPRLVTDPSLQGYFVRVIARLRPGVTLAQAQPVASVAQQQLLRDMYPSSDPRALRDLADRQLVLDSLAHGYSPQREAITQALVVLALIVGFLMAIACANVASLVAVRIMAREPEMALRRALGAGDGRIVRQVLFENGVLVVAAALLGLILASWTASSLATTVTTGQMRATVEGSFWLSFDPRIDTRALAFAAFLCFLAICSVGLWPARRGSRAALSAMLGDRGASSSSSPERARFGRAMVIAQVALSLLLLVDSTLLVRSLRGLRATDLGYDRRQAVLVWAQPGLTGRQGRALIDYWQTVVQRASAIPGVVAAGASNGGVLDGYEWSGRPTAPMRVAGQPDKPAGIPGYRQFVTPHFFEASGLPIIAGRAFSERDTDSAIRSVIINQRMAQYYFGTEDPIGRIVGFPGEDYTPTRVIGIVGNAVSGTPRQPALGLTYFLYRHPEATPARIGAMVLVLRTNGSAPSLAAAVGSSLRGALPDLPVLRIDTIEQQLDDVLSQDRLLAALGTFCAVVGAVLACVGLYGIIGYTTVRRTTEIGVRKALGATTHEVLSMVLREGLTLVIAGLVAGVPLVFGARQFVAARLVGVSPGDPLSFAVSAILLIVVSAVAVFIPAWRAASVDPMVALRRG